MTSEKIKEDKRGMNKGVVVVVFVVVHFCQLNTRYRWNWRDLGGEVSWPLSSQFWGRGQGSWWAGCGWSPASLKKRRRLSSSSPPVHVRPSFPLSPSSISSVRPWFRTLPGFLHGASSSRSIRESPTHQYHFASNTVYILLCCFILCQARPGQASPRLASPGIKLTTSPVA